MPMAACVLHIIPMDEKEIVRKTSRQYYRTTPRIFNEQKEDRLWETISKLLLDEMTGMRCKNWKKG